MKDARGSFLRMHSISLGNAGAVIKVVKMGHIGLPEIIIVALIIIILFGAKKIPEIGAGLGKAIKEFRKAGKEPQDDNENKTS